MKLLIDMNLSPKWVAALQRGGFEAVHWESVGPSSAPDEQIMEFALRHGFSVFTNDLDFGIQLAATHASRPSVIQIRCEDVRPEVLGATVVAALTHARAAVDRGASVTVRDGQSRTRLLPILQKRK